MKISNYICMINFNNYLVHVLKRHITIMLHEMKSSERLLKTASPYSFTIFINEKTEDSTDKVYPT